MLEQREVSSLEVRKSALLRSLRTQYIDFPLYPQMDNTVTAPRSWLIRGETNKNRLLHPREFPFTPQSGQWGSKGVFLGDCAQPLMYPSQGAFYVFEAQNMTKDWVITPSGQYQSMIAEIAERKGLNLQSISGGVSVEAALYDLHHVYQLRTGTVTVPRPVEVAQACKILLTQGFLDAREIDILPQSVREKVVFIE